MNEIQTPLVRENPASKYSCLYIVITICRDTRDYLVHSAQARNAQAVTCHTMLQGRVSHSAADKERGGWIDNVGYSSRSSFSTGSTSGDWPAGKDPQTVHIRSFFGAALTSPGYV
jgi:hypothetical protein